MKPSLPTSAVGPVPPFGLGELVRLDLASRWFSASPSGVVCRGGSAPGFRPGGRVTFFWRPRRKSPKKRAFKPSSKWSQPCGGACDSRGGGWIGRGASSVDWGPERSLLVVGGRTVSFRPEPVRGPGRRACGARFVPTGAPVHGRPRGPCSVPSCPASSGASGPRSTLLAPRPVHPPPRAATALHEARDSLELGLKALFFGDFLLGPQKKVTRPPGRIPGALPARQTTPDGAAENQRKARKDERVLHDRMATQSQQPTITHEAVCPESRATQSTQEPLT
jgi:hypothetical protein